MPVMKAFIEIDGLRVRAYHGVLPQERVVGNMFEVSLKLEYPPALEAVCSDRVSDTLDYARVVSIVRDVMTVPSALLEHVAGRIHSAIMSEYPRISGGFITVSKIAPPLPDEMTAARFTLNF